MELSKNATVDISTPPRRMTQAAMQQDFEYEMAQRLTKNMLEEGLITLDEYDRISALNQEKFSPFYADLMEK